MSGETKRVPTPYFMARFSLTSIDLARPEIGSGDSVQVFLRADYDEIAQEVRRLNDVIRVRNGTIDNLKSDVEGAAKIIATLRAALAAAKGAA